MGLDYSFEFITRTENLERLLKAFSKKLSKKDRDRLLISNKYEPEYEGLITNSWEEIIPVRMGVNLTINSDSDSKNYYCFSLLVDQDELIQEYYSKYPPNTEEEKFPLACVWTQLYVGEENSLLEISAATSDMSRLFENSSSIHNLCKEIAEEAKNTSIFLDKEDYLYWWQIYPEKKKYIRPDYDLFSNMEVLNVDAYVMEAERLADKNLC